MSEIIRQDTEYAMQALVCLAMNNGKNQVTAKELARSRNIPEDFAYKILRKLTHSGLTVSHMGYHGGFNLARSPENITFLQVVSAVQGPITIKKCCFKPDACAKRDVCEILPKLMDLQDGLIKSLDAITLSDVIKHESNNRTAGIKRTVEG